MSGKFFAKLRENPITENVGKPWLEKEEQDLLAELADNRSYADIAIVHKRTESGVRSHVAAMLYNDYLAKVEPGDILRKYRVTSDEYKQIIDRKLKKLKVDEEKRNVSASKSTNEVSITNDVIATRLNIIEQKLDLLIRVVSSLQ